MDPAVDSARSNSKSSHIGSAQKWLQNKNSSIGTQQILIQKVKDDFAELERELGAEPDLDQLNGF